MKYIVPANTNKIDGIERGIKPGDVIVLDAKNKYSQPLHFSNLTGVTVASEGKVELAMGPGFAYVVKFNNCSKVRFTGDFHLSGGNKDSIGISCENRTTDFEIEGIEVFNTGFTTLMCKDDSVFFGDFVMKNCSVHHCHFHHAGGEGAYIGNSSYYHKSGKRNHTNENFRFYANHVHDTMWDGFQNGNGVSAQVYDNLFENCGLADKPGQRNGIQIGEGTKALVYKNTIKNCLGNGVIVLGTGSHIYENKIFSAGESGIFTDARVGTEAGHKFTNNLILSPKAFGIAVRVKKFANEARHNIILNPGRGYFENGADINLKEYNNFLDMNQPLVEHYLNKP